MQTLNFEYFFTKTLYYLMIFIMQWSMKNWYLEINTQVLVQVQMQVSFNDAKNWRNTKNFSKYFFSSALYVEYLFPFIFCIIDCKVATARLKTVLYMLNGILKFCSFWWCKRVVFQEHTNSEGHDQPPMNFFYSFKSLKLPQFSLFRLYLEIKIEIIADKLRL